jgi:hypothetical protein
VSRYVITGGWLWSNVDGDFLEGLVVVMVELRWRRGGR